MIRNRCLQVWFVVLVVAACRSGGPVQVYTYWGATVERLPANSSYDWWPSGTALRASNEPADEGLERLVRQTVEAELEAMGFHKRSPDADVDFYVWLHLGRGFQPSASGPENRAMLMVDILDSSDEHRIYRAWADAAVDPTLTPEERKARIQHAVREVLKPLAP